MLAESQTCVGLLPLELEEPRARRHGWGESWWGCGQLGRVGPDDI